MITNILETKLSVSPEWVKKYGAAAATIGAVIEMHGPDWWAVAQTELASRSGLSLRVIRSALARLESAGEIEMRDTNTLDRTRSYRIGNPL